MKSKSNGKDFCTFALPGLFCFLAVVIVPFLYGVYLTLTDHISFVIDRYRAYQT